VSPVLDEKTKVYSKTKKDLFEEARERIGPIPLAMFPNSALLHTVRRLLEEEYAKAATEILGTATQPPEAGVFRELARALKDIDFTAQGYVDANHAIRREILASVMTTTIGKAFTKDTPSTSGSTRSRRRVNGRNIQLIYL
jgi:hypothetical protein